MSDKYGKIAQVIGPVVDVIFEGDMVPPIYTALKIDREDGSQLILEVESVKTPYAVWQWNQPTASVVACASTISNAPSLFLPATR